MLFLTIISCKLNHYIVLASNRFDNWWQKIIIFQYLFFNPIFFQDAHIATDTPHNENVENTKPVIELTSDDKNMEENELKTTWGK